MPSSLAAAARQQQFLDVITRDEATARFRRHLTLAPLGAESVPLAAALGRVQAANVAAGVDVSGFDRSNVDGFAMRAADTFGAMDESPRRVRLNAEVLSPGASPRHAVEPGTASMIATGAMLPRGADAVVMVEHTEVVQDGQTTFLEITRAAAPGENITFAGTDIARGETVLRAGQRVTSREIGVLAAIGRAEVGVFRRPRVAVLSTGNEIVPPGGPRPPGFVYDSNLAILSAAVSELGGEPVPLGVVGDDEAELARALQAALEHDVVILSGGTSKGAGDLSYRVLAGRLQPPGIVAHGVALKPGKPICLAVSAGKPVVILPGFPTSAIFTFHEFVAPVIRAFAGLPAESRETVRATLPLRINSDRGRTEYLLVGLVQGAAYPMGKGSGSVTAFSQADGFITIDQHTEQLEAGSTVDVTLLSRSLVPADLVVIGSHCVGLDLLLGEMHRRGFSTRSMSVGSTGGLAAARRGECDLAGIHLLDPVSGEYNRPFLTPELELVRGYRRMQSLVFRRGDPRFAGRSLEEALAAALADSECLMVNRNAGSGTRILIDGLLGGRRPPGYAVQPKSHNAVAAAVEQGRADWGVAIDTVARQYGLEAIPVQEEHYDFVVPKSRAGRPVVAGFAALLRDETVQSGLRRLGFLL
ncbi:MAG TPA: molybdopterin biosynthesis protein [Planctomycetaceae bacterium]|nr:molybdopterin biosynthesis protein [Planctomycetaceae bacterium]